MVPMIVLPQPPPTGFPIPKTHHAVSVQMTTWKDMQGLMLGHERIKKVQQIGYPRSFLHPDIVKVNRACLEAIPSSGQACLLYPSIDHALSCRKYIAETSKGGNVDNVHIIMINFHLEDEPIHGRISHQGSIIRVHAVFFDEAHFNDAMAFWRLAGTGISSRFAENLHRHIHLLKPTSLESFDSGSCKDELQGRFPSDTTANDRIRERIVNLLKRASRHPAVTDKVSLSDVFLYPTGMSAIYHCNLLLQEWLPAESIVFGFPYELTLKILQVYGKSYRFNGFGTSEELDKLEVYLKGEAGQGRRVQSVWCECASNPLLRTVDLDRIRELANKYKFQVVIDDTIGSFANVDVMSVADIIVTSLTKSFNGLGDAMGGSLVLNPGSPFYEDIKSRLSRTYRNELYKFDAITLEYNSRKFLPRVSRMNETAFYLVSLLQPYAHYAFSTLTQIYYPLTCWSSENYRRRMRRDSSDFKPGYGGLFTLEFESEKAASVFFDNLEVHKGPSLGVVVTLAQPYVQTVFARDKEWAASYGLSETIVRISVGLENQEALGKAFKRALRFADCTKRGIRSLENLDACA